MNNDRPLKPLAKVGPGRWAEYFEIAELMRPDEFHPGFREKLDAICTAFGGAVAAPAGGTP